MLLMGKLTISMAMFNSYVKLPEGIQKSLSQAKALFHHNGALCVEEAGILFSSETRPAFNSTAWRNFAKRAKPSGESEF